jgi:DNA polymerase-3 subunit epsilon
MLTLVIDTETTGIPDFKLPADHPSQPRLCSLAMGVVDQLGQIVSMHHRLVRPEAWPEEIHRTSAAAFAINGFTIERLMDEGEPIAGVLEEFDKQLMASDGVAGYAVSFDEKIMRGELRRRGMPDRYGARQVCDVMRSTSRHLGRTRVKLTDAVEFILGRPHIDAHDAKADMLATAELFNWFRQRDLVEWKTRIPAALR